MSTSSDLWRDEYGEESVGRDALAQADGAERHVQRVRRGARPRLDAHAHAPELQLHALRTLTAFCRFWYTSVGPQTESYY